MQKKISIFLFLTILVLSPTRYVEASVETNSIQVVTTLNNAIQNKDLVIEPTKTLNFPPVVATEEDSSDYTLYVILFGLIVGGALLIYSVRRPKAKDLPGDDFEIL